MTPQDKLRKALAETPDENIGWIALAIQETVRGCVTDHGFLPESQKNWNDLDEILKELLGGI